jgi:hypothetical protein
MAPALRIGSRILPGIPLILPVPILLNFITTQVVLPAAGLHGRPPGLGGPFSFALCPICLFPSFFAGAAAVRKKAREGRIFILNAASLTILAFPVLFTLISLFRGR